MADKLSLPNLLNLLLFDQQGDDVIRKQCDKAEELRRRYRYKEAIEIAQYAVQLALDQSKPNYNLHGVALLYLSVARLSSNLPGQNVQAIRDCDAAITNLRLAPHNCAIAEIIRAQMELLTYGDDSERVSFEQVEAIPEAKSPPHSQHAKLRQNLIDHFSDEELRTLCFDMGVDYETLPAQGKAGKVREFIADLVRKDRIPELVKECFKRCSNVSWKDMLETASEASTISPGTLYERSHGKHSALLHLQIAIQILQKQIQDWRVPPELKQIESEILGAVQGKVSELITLQSKAQPVSLAPKRHSRPITMKKRPSGTTPATPTSADLKAPPTSPITPDSMRLEFVPVYDSFAGASRQSDAPSTFGVQPEYLEISQFSIKNKLYTLRLLETKTGTGTLRLRRGQQYIAIQVKGDSMEPTILNGEYALVRRQSQPDRDKQIVAVIIGPQTAGIPDTALIKYMRKHNHNLLLESDNPAYPPIEYTDENTPIEVIGVVDAILKPITTSELPPPPAPTSPPPTLEELLVCVDDLHTAEGLNSAIDKGLAAIRGKFQKYLTQNYGLELLPIVPGQTPFDPQQHEAITYEHRPDLPTGIILKINGDGYHYKGKVFRPAKVTVNQ